ncbi:hypothetical protein SAMN04488063_0019 [Halopelagius inordinatus]|uniref:Uncharacterized protein n=1 Tax=Halopelagius inordinatus TaxID=553467 RepID=A0A1I2WXX9_9EURY|nr:hypothetical protein [Halopelagius inordinatus]SFH05286.1 hypothetical protein SAMN04488063_0019 [Halopelagius inordinatus]
MTDTKACRVCGAEKPTAVVRETTVDPIAPLRAEVCRTCEFVQNHSLPDDRCAQCGESVKVGFSLELEYPLGEAELPAFIAVTLCDDCASWVACDIAYGGVDADEEAHDQYIDLIDREMALQREAEERARCDGGRDE